MLKRRAQDAVAGMCNTALVPSGAKHATARSASTENPKVMTQTLRAVVTGITGSVFLAWITHSLWRNPDALRKLKQPRGDVVWGGAARSCPQPCDWIIWKGILSSNLNHAFRWWLQTQPTSWPQHCDRPQNRITQMSILKVMTHKNCVKK